jgi:hypothetical protein
MAPSSLPAAKYPLETFTEPEQLGFYYKKAQGKEEQKIRKT